MAWRCAALRNRPVCLAAADRAAYACAMTIQRYEVGPRMSQAVVYGGVAYLAGIVADELVPSVEAQTRQILGKIDRLLAAVGTDKTRLLKANIWLADISRFAEMNTAWDAWVAPGHPPARATVEARLATADYLVEIMVEAAVA
jgi:enamine deaminase RidA (YjgF/YER057c/UK114 family)